MAHNSSEGNVTVSGIRCGRPSTKIQSEEGVLQHIVGKAESVLRNFCIINMTFYSLANLVHRK